MPRVPFRLPLTVLALLVAIHVWQNTASSGLSASETATAPSQEKEDNDAEDEGLPLTPTSTIDFTVDEGTWMSVDVSPDGTTLVFDLLGDLYTLPVSGGEAARIFGDLSFESQPVFSPDGKTIAFLSDRSGVENLWLADADGANPRPVSEDKPTGGRPQLMASPSWTADGDYILVSKARPPDRTFHLFLYHRDGGSGIRVGPKVDPPKSPPVPGGPQPPNRLGAVASSEGRFIYYSERKGSFNYNAQFPIWQVYRYDRQTSDVGAITNAQGSGIRPVLSPDGQYLVYGTRHRNETALRVRDLEQNQERWLTFPVTRDDQESRASRDALPGYAFMPDGSALIVPIGGKLFRVDFETGDRSEIPFHADVSAAIGPRLHYSHRIDDSPTVRARVIRWSEPSPDGKQLAFSAFSHVWVTDLSSQRTHRLTDLNQGEFMPSWSPDGTQIVFATWTTEGGHLYRATVGSIDSRPADAERLTKLPAYYREPIFTPDGKAVVFLMSSAEDQLLSNLPSVPNANDTLHAYQDTDQDEIGGIRPPQTAELRRLTLGGDGTATRIGPSKGGRFLHFTDDSERVFFTTPEGLQSIRLDGFDSKTHFKIVGDGPGPRPPTASEIVLSPDGSSAFVSLQNEHFLVQIPRVGKDPLEIKVGKGPSIVPVTRLQAEIGNHLGFSNDGANVYWSQGNRFYRQAIDDLGSEQDPRPQPTQIDVVVEKKRHKPSGQILLRGAKLITMKGDEILDPADILITDNRITSVAPNLEAPAGAKIIDAAGKIIMPGFVDAHAHMWAPRGVHQTQVWQHLANLAYGVTTTRDPQTSTDDVFAYMDLSETGAILSPRIYATGPGVFSNIGIQDAESASKILGRYRKAYDSKTIKQYVAGDRIVRQWIAMAAQEHELTPTTEGALDLKLDLTQMADGYSGHEHSLPIIPIYDDVARYVAETNTFYTPTILVAYGGPWTENLFFQNTDVAKNEKLSRFIPHQILDNMVRRRGQWFIEEEYVHKGIAEGCARVVKAGGKCCLGSHGQLQGLGAHWETWALQSGGLSEHETLRAITLHGAEAIGFDEDLGSLEPGKLADLIVLDKDPLEDIRHTVSILYVMRNGELFEAATLDQLWPEERPLEKPYWLEQTPTRAVNSKQ